MPWQRAQHFTPGIHNRPGSRLGAAADSTVVAEVEQAVGHRVGSQSADTVELHLDLRSLLVSPGMAEYEQIEELMKVS